MVGSLNSALSGLRVAQQELNVISNNISNATTPGYTRKTLPRTSQIIGNTGAGVSAGAISRNVNTSLQNDVFLQKTIVSNLDVKISYFDRVQQYLGRPDEQTSISSELSELRDLFVTLADSPEDTAVQNNLILQSETFAQEVRGFASLINELRNDTQEEIAVTVNRVNTLLEQVANLNRQVRTNTAAGKSTASLLDQRDTVVEELSQIFEVNSFTRGDGVLVIQTPNGTQLADERVEPIVFNITQVGPSDTYTNGGINGIFVGGTSAADPGAVDITNDGLNGKLGALIELRDELLVEQQAILDELAHKIALRFEAQGLRLYTNDEGLVPADTAPDPSAGTGVPYVGFSAEFRVNQAILDNTDLIKQGTVDTDLGVQSGSDEVLRRIVEFAFGEIEYQQATSARSLQTTATDAGAPADNLQELLGLYDTNTISGLRDLSDASFPSIQDIFDSGAITPGNDAFSIRFQDPHTGNFTINIDLTDAQAAFPAPPAASAAEQIVNQINDRIDATLLDHDLNYARIGSSGNIIIESRSTVTIFEESSPAGTGMGADGLEVLGLAAGTYEAESPYFDIQVGNDPVVRITIEPTDTELTLKNKLEYGPPNGGVPGLHVDFDPAGGQPVLTLRPGNDTDPPVFGGDIKIIGGPFETSPTDNASPEVSDVTPEPILLALFGSTDPVVDVPYGSAVSDDDGTNVTFRTRFLGPDGNITTGLVSSSTLVDFSQKLINRQSELLNQMSNTRLNEESFMSILEQDLLGSSGVNIEEELALLIQVQTAFSASARIVAAVDEQFRELLQIF